MTSHVGPSNVEAIAALLTPGQIQVAAWYFVDGFNQCEIAGFLGVSQPAVSFRIGRIRRRLAKAGFPPPARRVHLPPSRRIARLVRSHLVEGAYAARH